MIYSEGDDYKKEFKEFTLRSALIIGNMKNTSWL